MKKIFPFTLVILVLVTWLTIFMDAYSKPVNYTKYVNSGDALVEQQLYLKAIEQYQNAKEYKKTYEIAEKLINCYKLMGDTDSYISMCDSTIEYFPNEIKTYLQVLNYYKNIGSDRDFVVRAYKYKQLFPADENINHLYLEAAKIYYESSMNVDSIRLDENNCYAVYAQAYDAEEDKQKEICILKDQSDNEIFKYDYKDKYLSDNNREFLVKDYNDNWKLVNGQNYTISFNNTVNFEKVTGFSCGYATGVVNGKYHYINNDLLISNTEYEFASSFSENVGAIEKNGRWALISAKDNVNYEGEYVYEDIAINSLGKCCINGNIIVEQNGKYFIINKDGKKIGKNTYDYIKAFESSQPTVYMENQKYGFINQYGEKYTDPVYEDAKPYQNGVAAIKQNGKWGYIDKYGNIIVEPQFSEVMQVTTNGIAFVCEENGQWKMLTLGLLYYNS